VVALHVNGESLVEADTTTVKLQRGSFKLGGLPIAPLCELPETEGLGWQPAVPPIPSLQVGDELVLADTGWFNRRYMEHLLAQHDSGVRDYSAPLWTLLMFDAYLHQAMGHEAARALREAALDTG
jgi:hypothetical protein